MFSGILLLPVLGLENVTGQLFRPVIILFYYYMMVNFAENKTIGKISWDIIHPDFQGKSLGTKLLKYRIEVLKTIPGIQKITVRTLQVAYKFYEK